VIVTKSGQKTMVTAQFIAGFLVDAKVRSKTFQVVNV
jgi:hypothetical protein